VGGVSTSSVERAKRLMREDPEAHAAIKRGEKLSVEERRARAAQKARQREDAARALDQDRDDELRQRAQRVFERMGITVTAFSDMLAPCYSLAKWAFEKYLSEDETIGDHRRGLIARALDDLREFGSLEAVVKHHQERKDRHAVEILKMY
jgi:antitoxin component of RelBE/YafQ-DinJ toxin-antitoxin module